MSCYRGASLAMDKPRILVIDDNAENRALAQAALEDEGFEVVLAATGEAGVTAFQEGRPDCVLLDVRMPGLDGFAVCGRIRELPGGPETPVLFLTALRDVDTFDRALRAGGDDFLTKPVRPTELLVRVQSALKLRRMGAELREHYDLVRSQRDALMRLQLQKERLSAFVIHDLKNPVSSMDLHAQLVLRDPQLAPKARQSVERIREDARSLLRLLLNLLDLSRSEEGELVAKKGELDLDSLVREAMETLDAKARNGGVALVRAVDVAGPVHADADLLRRVLENLLENAVRHAPEGSEVRVSAGKHAGQVVLRVSDQGVGIDPALRERVFERFVQLEHGERVVARTSRGLGLTFCRSAVEAHGGKIWVEDGNPGAVFCVSLPDAP